MCGIMKYTHTHDSPRFTPSPCTACCLDQSTYTRTHTRTHAHVPYRHDNNYYDNHDDCCYYDYYYYYYH